MNIVITGATSFIGVAVINKFIEEGAEHIWAVIRPNSANRSKVPVHEKVSVIELDMQELSALDAYITEPVDVFIHLAWEGVRAPYRDDANLQRQNYLAAKAAIEVCEKLGCRKFIGSGSQAEYGSMDGLIAENYVCTPNTEYGKAKLRACMELEAYANEHQMDYIWTRIFSVFGAGDFKGSLVMNCLDKMQKGETLELTACEQQWDYLYIDEVAAIFYLLATKKCENGIYNLASGEHRKLKDYVESMKNLTGSDSEILYGAIPYPASGMVSFIPDVEKLKTQTGWRLSISFEQGIKYMLRENTYEKN